MRQITGAPRRTRWTMHMEYQEWPAPEGTEHLIRCCWSLRALATTAPAGAETAEDEAAEPALPDGCPELILNLRDPWRHVANDGQTRDQPQSFLVGQITGPFVVHPTGHVDLMAVRFEPYGAAALTSDLSQLTDTWKSLDTLRQEASEPLSAVLGSLQMVWCALPTLAPDIRRAQLAGWLRAYAALKGHADDVVIETVEAIVRSRGAVTIDDVASSRGVHLRTLQRRFMRQVGVSPKRLARVVRFHHVCQEWRRDPDTLARVAADCGYCDESHLVRDFRAFVGEPPATFLKALPAFAAHFL